ncbi:MAG: 3-oxo-5-alpha-steroid 4-dehydrogenase [Fluviicola sp. XM-24bin1]|jgi:steroid 5-alpha reductase family enzyme|nr:MAG: 3-oxo-5-alpha-steroid 4-dehydrogenase [Fluviicola sp. XM-24bin1]
MIDQYFIELNFIWIGVAVVTFLALIVFKIRAPYGRHANDKWGKMIANHWGWFWMELPAFLLFPLITIFGPREKDLLTWILVGMWSLHYLNRTIIFPFRLRTRGKKMPLTIVFSALFFNGANGFLNGYWLGFLAPKDNAFSILTILGIVLFFSGMYINMGTDNRLIALRKQQGGYQIPRGWLFRYISCPNHFGEMAEWTGFAIAACSVPAWTFAIWTMCNLIPRAINHHDWYHETFEDYPKNRKAFLPKIW